MIVMPPFMKSSVFKIFSLYTKTQSERLQISPSGLKTIFDKLRFRDGLSVDGRRNRRNKAAFSNFFSVVWMGP